MTVLLKATGATGVVHRGNGVQVIYGPNVTVIKSNLEDYLEKAPDTYAETEAAKAEETEVQPQEAQGQKVIETITVCSPITGLAADLSTVPDEAFAGKMMGRRSCGDTGRSLCTCSGGRRGCICI